MVDIDAIEIEEPALLDTDYHTIYDVAYYIQVPKILQW